MTRRRFRPRTIIEAALWIILVGFIASRMWPQVTAAFGVRGAGEPAPDFQVITTTGDSVSLASLRGNVVLVNFWATWCPPCRVEMPGFQRVYEARKQDGFTVVGISTDVAPDMVALFLAERGITFPVAMAGKSVGSRFGGVHMLPTSFLLDREGRIQYEVRGIFSETALARAVDRLLAEPSRRPALSSRPAAH